VWVGNGQQFKFTLLEFYRGGEALSRIQQVPSYNPPPPVGAEYLLFRLRMDFVNGGATAVISSSDFAVIDSQNREYPFDSGPNIIPPNPPFFDKETIGVAFRYSREVTVNSLSDGWMAFTIAAGDPHAMLVYGHPMSDFQSRVSLDTK